RDYPGQRFPSPLVSTRSMRSLLERIAGRAPVGVTTGFGADEVQYLRRAIQMAQCFEMRLFGTEMREFGQGIQVGFDISRGADEKEDQLDLLGVAVDCDPFRSAHQKAGALLEHTAVLMAESDSLAWQKEHLPGGEIGTVPERFA